MADEEEQQEMEDQAEGMDAGEGEDADEEEEGGSQKMIMIIAGAAVLLLGGGAGLYFTGMLDGLLGKEKKECVEEVDEHGEVIKECPKEEHSDDKHAKDDHGKGKDDGQGKDGKAGGGKYLEIPTMLVNLNTDDGTPRYLRLSVQIELKSAADYGTVEAVIPRVIDQFQTYLRELRVKDLRGSAGIYRLQMELLWRVNQAAAPVKVKDVLFQEILIQ